MKIIRLWTTLVLFACGLGAALADFGQIDPDLVIKTVPVRVQKTAIQAFKVALPSVKGDVKTLVRQYGLDSAPTVNPKLVFGSNEVKYWSDKHLDKKALKLEFAARRIVLDAADKQNVAIRDQDMLSAAAREVIPLLQEGSKAETGLNTPSLICGSRFGERSEELIKRAWDALNGGQGGVEPKNFEKALACTTVTIDSYAEDADEQQAMRLKNNECKRIPSAEENEKTTYFTSYYALSDIAAALFIRGQVFEQQKNCTEAKKAYKIITEKYTCAYIWDPRVGKTGVFWSAAKGAEKALKNLEKYGCPGIVQ